MRQSLALGVRPKFSANHEFPKIPLGKGLWRVETEYHIDTKLSMVIYTATDNQDGGKYEVPSVHMFNAEMVINGPVKIQVLINEGGSEPFINVVAVRQ